MAKTRATIGYLGELFIGDSSSPTNYTSMLEVISIKPALMTVPVINATHLKSPNATEEKIPGLIMPGTMEAEVHFIGDTTQLNIATLARGRTVFPYKFTAPVDNGTKVYTCIGNGFISKYEHGSIEASGIHNASLTMELAGDFTETVV